MVRTILALAVALASSNCQAAPVAKEFSKEFLGRWGENEEGCSPGAVHGGLTIEATRLYDGEASGEVRSTSRNPDGSLNTVELWDLLEEQPTTITFRYELSKDGTRLTVTDAVPQQKDGYSPQVLIRCAHGAG